MHMMDASNILSVDFVDIEKLSEPSSKRQKKLQDELSTVRHM